VASRSDRRGARRRMPDSGVPFGVELLPFNWGFCRSLFPVWVDRGGRLTYECIFRRRILFYIAGLSRARWTS
jgi:hypothetical protein